MYKVLTIVVPCYNVEQYLSKTIKSILKCHKLELLDVIIVNDGSTDGTAKIAEKLGRRASESIRIINKENGGHGSTINSGLAHAQGKYLIVVDGDDWIAPNVMDIFLGFLNNHHSDIVVTGHYRNYVNSGEVEKYSYCEKIGFETNINYLLAHNILLPMTDICYRTQMLRDVNLTIQEHLFYVDEEFCCIPFQKVETILFFSEGFYHYRIGDVNQSISIENTIKRIDHKVKVFMYVMKTIEWSELAPENREYIIRKAAGMAKAIFLVYYVYFTDKKKGRKRGDQFCRLLGKLYLDIMKRCQKVQKILRLMGYLHINAFMWERYQKSKQGRKEKHI